MTNCLTRLQFCGLGSSQSELLGRPPPYHPNTPTCLWKMVIEWVYVVKLINHINLYLLVGWLKAMTIRLMKLVNSSYPHYTLNYNEPKKKERKSIEKETVVTKLAIKILLLIECLLLLMMRFIKKTLREEY